MEIKSSLGFFSKSYGIKTPESTEYPINNSKEIITPAGNQLP